MKNNSEMSSVRYFCSARTTAADAKPCWCVH